MLFILEEPNSVVAIVYCHNTFGLSRSYRVFACKAASKHQWKLCEKIKVKMTLMNKAKTTLRCGLAGRKIKTR